MKFKVDPMKGDFNSALEVLRTMFEDVIAPTCQVFLQLKREDWSGEFVDIGEMDTIPDRSVIRAVVERQVCGWLCSSLFVCIIPYLLCFLFCCCCCTLGSLSISLLKLVGKPFAILQEYIKNKNKKNKIKNKK